MARSNPCNRFRLTIQHALYFVLALIAFLGVFNIHPSLRTFDKTPFPANPDLQLDYARMHKIAVPVLVLDALTGIIAFTVLATDVLRTQSLPVFVEVAWLTVVLAMQTANIALLAVNHPRLIDSLSDSGSAIGGIYDQNGKVGAPDAAATILVSYDFAALVTAVLVFFILVHLVWNLLVSFRHTRVRPEVFGEPVPDNYPWTLEVPATPTFVKPASGYPFRGAGNVFVTEESHQLA